MPLRSAYEDFVGVTLHAVPGAAGRLLYLRSLRDSEGSYHHWGLERTYGKEVSCQAIAQAQSDVIQKLLRSPLRRLVDDLLVQDRREMEELLRSGEQMVAGLSKSEAAHLEYLFSALTALPAPQDGSQAA